MHHLAFGIHFKILFVSLVSPVWIHLSTHLCHHRHSIHHSFTLSLQAQTLFFQQIIPTLTLVLYSLDCLHDHETGSSLSRSSVYFFSFFLLIFFTPCGKLSWLPVSFFILQVKYTVSYRIVTRKKIEEQTVNENRRMCWQYCDFWNFKSLNHQLFFLFFFFFSFLSRVSILTRDIDIANLSVCLSVCPSVWPSVTFRYQMKTA